jgi:HSP20 family protein
MPNFTFQDANSTSTGANTSTTKNSNSTTEPIVPMVSGEEKTTPEIKSSTNKTESTENKSGDWKPDDVPQLTVDVYKKNETIYVVSTVAGVKPEDLDISIDNQTLSIRGLRKKPALEDGLDTLLEECFWGVFYRELTINENLNVNAIKADLKDGVLIIQIPVIKVIAQKKIKVNAGS